MHRVMSHPFPLGAFRAVRRKPHQQHRPPPHTKSSQFEYIACVFRFVLLPRKRHLCSFTPLNRDIQFDTLESVIYK